MRLAEDAVARHWSLRGLLAGLALALLAGCQSTPTRVDVDGAASIDAAAGEIPEGQLLDVGIRVFKPGDLDEEQVDEEGLSEEVREAEARFIPVHLKHTMQRTGHWGAVRVVPELSDSVDVVVKGLIVDSDGETLHLRLVVLDATGREWFSRDYATEIAPSEYGRTERGHRDAFQAVYNAIANDMVGYKGRLNPTEIDNIRTVSELRFAEDLAPEAFAGYLEETDDGEQSIARLPARNDPMLQRVQRVRERDYLLVDTVNGYYDGFYDDMWEPYVSWRKFRSEEAEQLRELQRKARTRQALGVAAFIGAIALDVLVGGSNAASARNLLLIGGGAALKSGIDLGGQTEIHEDAIRELGASFEAEVEPLVIDVDGETVRLTGNAETQYGSWRRLLNDIYLRETGLEGGEDFIVREAEPLDGKPVQEL